MTSRVALVTGGTGGIGTAIVKRLADMGHKVATNYRNEEKARAWQDKMKSEGYDIALVKGDVTSPEEAEAMVREVETTLGPVDILVNNAGDDVSEWGGRDISWEELTELEPKLVLMYRTICMLRLPPRPETFCAHDPWRDIFLPSLKILVGWYCKRHNSALRSTEAYEEAHQKLWSAMPNCQGCCR